MGYRERDRTEFIAIHCSATKPKSDITADDIRRWHRARGWQDIGYHFVVRRSGSLELGRPEGVWGAHVKGYNDISIGICLIGGVAQDDVNQPENNFTDDQFGSLEWLVTGLLCKYPDSVIKGHRDFPNVHKACPSFDVKEWWSDYQVRKHS